LNAAPKFLLERVWISGGVQLILAYFYASLGPSQQEQIHLGGAEPGNATKYGHA